MELSATEIRNVLGIYDDDLLNAAVECERKDDLSEEIARAIVMEHGYTHGLYKKLFSFEKIKSVLERFGFKYEKSDEDSESHLFVNQATGDVIEIYPVIWYSNQGLMHFQNFILS